MSKEISVQAKYKKTNLKLINDISKSSSLEVRKIKQLLSKMHLRLDNSVTQRLLIVIRASDPESFLDAYYRYIEDIDSDNNSARNVTRFSFYLIHSKSTYINLSEEANITEGMFDEVDDLCSLDDLDYSIGILENEDY